MRSTPFRSDVLCRLIDKLDIRESKKSKVIDFSSRVNTIFNRSCAYPPLEFASVTLWTFNFSTYWYNFLVPNLLRVLGNGKGIMRRRGWMAVTHSSRLPIEYNSHLRFGEKRRRRRQFAAELMKNRTQIVHVAHFPVPVPIVIATCRDDHELCWTNTTNQWMVPLSLDQTVTNRM